MGNFERELENSRRERIRRNSDQLIDIRERLTPSIDDFSHIPEEEKRRDKSYVNDRKARFRANNEREGSFNEIVERGVEAALMIQIATGAILNDPANDTYTSEPIFTTDYDDISNRNDAGVTIFAGPDSNSDHEAADLTFGIDFTTSSNPDTISDKLLISTNNSSLDLPVGFTQIKYYRNSTKKEQGVVTVPRYCLGVDHEAACDILDETTFANGRVSFGNLSTFRFKILYEMYLQNGLYEAPLIAEDNDDNLPDKEQPLLRQMELLDNIYMKELDRIAKTLPKYLTDGTESHGKFDVEKIAQRLQTGDNADQTFRLICEQAKTITDKIYDTDNPRQKLNELSQAARDNKHSS